MAVFVNMKFEEDNFHHALLYKMVSLYITKTMSFELLSSILGVGPLWKASKKFIYFYQLEEERL